MSLRTTVSTDKLEQADRLESLLSSFELVLAYVRNAGVTGGVKHFNADDAVAGIDRGADDGVADSSMATTENVGRGVAESEAAPASMVSAAEEREATNWAS